MSSTEEDGSVLHRFQFSGTWTILHGFMMSFFLMTVKNDLILFPYKKGFYNTKIFCKILGF